MESKVAVYESHEKALNAVHLLNEKKFPLKNVSIVGEAIIIEDHIHLKSKVPLINTPLAIGAIAGTVTGILTGIGIFAIPGFGLGIVSGGLGTIFASLGVKKDAVVKYEEHLHEGRFLLLVNGSMDEITKAEHLLHTEGMHLE